MEKPANFSIIKQKIIKTDEVLRMYKAKTDELKKVQLNLLQLKSKFEFKTGEIAKLKLENEHLSYNYENVNEKYHNKTMAHENLQMEFSRLEKDYHDTINNLQLKYQSVSRELIELQGTKSTNQSPQKKVDPKCTDSGCLKIKKKHSSLEAGFQDLKLQLELTRFELCECRTKLDKAEDDRQNCDSLVFMKENQQLEEFKKRNNELEIELYKLKKQGMESTDKQPEDDSETKIQSLESKIISIQSEKAEMFSRIESLQTENSSYRLQISLQESAEENEGKNLNEMKQLKENLSKIHEDNYKLKQILTNYELEISLLNEQLRNTNSTPNDADISRVLNEMILPRSVSPLSSNHSVFDHFEPHHLLQSETNEIVSPPSEFVNEGLRRRRIRQLKRNRVRLRVKRRRKPKIDVFAVLKAFQRNNIKFTITNEVPTSTSSSNFGQQPHNLHRYFPGNFAPFVDIKNQRKEKVFKEIENCLGGCTNLSHMVLEVEDDDDDDENFALLGFFDVKSEIDSRASSRVGDNVPVDETRLIPSVIDKRKSEDPVFESFEEKRIRKDFDDNDNGKIRNLTEEILPEVDNTETSNCQNIEEFHSVPIAGRKTILRRSLRSRTTIEQDITEDAAELDDRSVIQQDGPEVDNADTCTSQDFSGDVNDSQNTTFVNSVLMGSEKLEVETIPTKSLRGRRKILAKIRKNLRKPGSQQSKLITNDFSVSLCKKRLAHPKKDDSSDIIRNITTDAVEFDDANEITGEVQQNEPEVDNKKILSCQDLFRDDSDSDDTTNSVSKESRGKNQQLNSNLDNSFSDSASKRLATTKREDSSKIRPDIIENSVGLEIQQNELEVDSTVIFNSQSASVNSVQKKCDRNPIDEQAKVDGMLDDSNANRRDLNGKAVEMGDATENVEEIQRIESEVDNRVTIICQDLFGDVNDLEDTSPVAKEHEKPFPRKSMRGKRFAHNKNNDISVDNNIVDTNQMKTTFKRPVCSLRRSARLQSNSPPKLKKPNLLTCEDSLENVQIPITYDFDYDDCPKSPPPEDSMSNLNVIPKIIPLAKVVAMPPSKIEQLFAKLINFGHVEEALDEIVDQFKNQDSNYIAEAVLERISRDYYDQVTIENWRAPLMTDVQRSMLGFMIRIDRIHKLLVCDHYLDVAEMELLTCTNLNVIAPITRLYLGICKSRRNIHRVRRFCCDFFHSGGDLVIPFFFIVLTSWIVVLPKLSEAKYVPLPRVLVQVVHMKHITKPGYSLLALKDLLVQYYGYPPERWDSDELFLELFIRYIRQPTLRSLDYCIQILCKNHPDKWVFTQIQDFFIPLVDRIWEKDFKSAVIILIGNLSYRFSVNSDYSTKITQWMFGIISEQTFDEVKLTIYQTLQKLLRKC